MPLVVLSGQPASGKSTVAESLKSLFEAEGQSAIVLDEAALKLERNSSYKDSCSQKNTRGSLRSAAERLVSRSVIVILDSINNIKGFRYELWCIARSAATNYCVVHVDTPDDICREWNEDREGDKYSAEIIEDLLRCFETPDSRSRWDSPLFTVKPVSGEVDGVLGEVVSAILGKNEGFGVLAKNLTPTCATENAPLSATNAQFEIDRAAQSVIATILEVQSEAGGDAAGLVTFGDGLPQLEFSRFINVAELRRLKRAFLKLATQIVASRVSDALTAKKLFIDYIEENLH